MHLLLIHQAFAGPDDPGGTRHFEFARHLVREGHTVTIVASNLAYKTGKPVVPLRGLVAEQQIEGVRVLRAYTLPTIHRSFVWRVVAFLSFMLTSAIAALRAGNVDLVMGTSPPIFQAVSAWIVSVLRRRPFLLEVRDLWPEFAIDIGVLKNPVLIWLSRRLEAFLYARATHLLVNSPAYRDYLMTKQVADERITLIPNGVDPTMFDPHADGSRLRKQTGLEDKFVVTYAGALGMANDLPTVLQAAEILRERGDLHFLVVGDGKERAALEARAQQLQLPNLTFIGPFPKSEMGAVLAASDACLAILRNIPMFRTTYPNKVFDYMAAGKPTVLAIDGVIRDVIEASRGGVFVPPGDAAALANGVVRLADDRATACAMGRSARAYVVQFFNRAQHAQQFALLVAQLAHHQPTVPASNKEVAQG